MRQRHVLQIFLVALLWASLLLIGGWLPGTGPIPTASAHSFVIGSDPIDGSTISKPPTVVRIFFDAPLAPASQARVLAFPPGTTANGVLVNAGPSKINASNPRELDTALLPANKLPLGGYEVRWTALSLTDGHTTSGLIGFNLGQSSIGVDGVPTLGPSTSNYFPQISVQGIIAIAWDWFALLALCLWIGLVVTEYFIVPRAASAAFLGHIRKQTSSLQAFCLVAFLVAEIINIVLRSTTFTSTLTGQNLSVAELPQLVLHSQYGWLWLIRVGLLILALLLLGGDKYRQRRLQGRSPEHTPLSPRKRQRFTQLRQQAQKEANQETSAKPASLSLSGRVSTGTTDALAAPLRSTIASLPKVTKSVEAPIHIPGVWRISVELGVLALVLLTLALSNEITQLIVLPISAGVLLWLGLAAQGIWFGCLAYLGLILLPLLPQADPDHHAETLLRLLKYALPWLLAALGVLLVSDLFLGEATLQAPTQLLNDPYGRTFLVKGLLLVLMLIFTGYIFWFLLPRLQRQTVLLPVVDAEMPARRARTVALEQTEHTITRTLRLLSGLAAATLLCVAIMQFFAPPVVFPNVNYAALVNAAATPGNQPPASQTQQVGNLTVTLQVLPARAGVANRVLVTLHDAQGRAITDATVKLSINMQIMDMGTTSSTMQEGNATYTADLATNQAFAMPGPWLLQVEIDQPNQSPVHAAFQVLIAP